MDPAVAVLKKELTESNRRLKDEERRKAALERALAQLEGKPAPKKSGTRKRRKITRRPLDVRLGEAREFLAGRGEVTGAELAEGIGLSPNGINKIVGALVGAGDLKRSPRRGPRGAGIFLVQNGAREARVHPGEGVEEGRRRDAAKAFAPGGGGVIE